MSPATFYKLTNVLKAHSEDANAVPEEQKSRSQHKPNFSRTRGRQDVPDSPLLERVQKWILHHGIEHVHGSEEVQYEIDELVVLAVMRDARPYVRSFVEHYRGLGVKHVVFLDNGSTDGTVEALAEYEDVTVLRTRLPFKRYGISMRQYLVERFGQRRWTLNVDIDELFAYPYQDVVSLGALLRYLNDNSYTAVVAHMLDMFPEKPLAEGTVTEDEPLKELHRFYDVSNIREQSYDLAEDTGNKLANPEIKIFRDGIRQTLFSLPTLLIKHPLIFMDGTLKPMDLSEHWTTNARIADFTGVLLHYKLMDRLFGMVRKEIRARDYPNRWGKYDNYLETLEASDSLQIKTETARELESMDELIANRYVVVSDQYMKFVERKNLESGGSPEHYAERLLRVLFEALAEAKEQSERFANIREELGVERLRNQERMARTRVRELQTKVAELQDRLKKRQSSLRDRQEELDAAKAQSRRLNAELDRERQRVNSLEKQMEAIKGSRSWRTLDALNQTRRRLLGRK